MTLINFNNRSAFVLLSLLVLSCSQTHDYNAFYHRRTIDVNDSDSPIILDSTEYDIKKFCTLNLPDLYKSIQCDKIEYVGGYFYLLDSELNHTIFVFDSVGNYVSHLGQQGRSSSEYVDKPTDFFVNDIDDKVEVFERNAHRIHTYNRVGEQIELNIFNKIWPYSIGTMFNGTYVAAFDYKEAGYGLQLGVFDKKENIILPVLDIDGSHVFVNNERTFALSSQSLYHIPNFSDSVFVFKSDTINSVIHLNFQSDFISQDIINDAKNGKLEKYTNFQGITSISGYYETSDYITFSYTKAQMQRRCIIHKQNNLQYHFLGTPFKGLFPGYRYTIVGKDIFWLITKDDVEDIMFALNAEPVRQELRHTHTLIQKIIQEKISLPVVLKINIKDYEKN